uniref:Uncharacterized protein n=1 Tax=mine drainage metagenome TaxID=410659 RepID=E6QW53_9ZZZZ
MSLTIYHLGAYVPYKVHVLQVSCVEFGFTWHPATVNDIAEAYSVGCCTDNTSHTAIFLLANRQISKNRTWIVGAGRCT